MTVPNPRFLHDQRAVPDAVGAALRAGTLIALGSRSFAHGRGRSILCGVAGLMSSATVNQMATHGRGLLSIAVDAKTAFRLGLRRMGGSARGLPSKPEYLVSIEASACAGSGISASDRALTLRAVGAFEANQEDLVTPGHIMPLLVRDALSPTATLPEIAHSIVAGNTPYAVAAWCDVLDDDGEVASLDGSARLAETLAIPLFVPDENVAWPMGSAFFPGPGARRHAERIDLFRFDQGS